MEDDNGQQFAAVLKEMGLIRFGGHLPKGGYDVQNGIKQSRTAGAAPVHGGVHGGRRQARLG